MDFREFIDQTIRKCKVVLVVIGPQWLDISDAHGRRLDQPNDPVRIEVETAIRWRKHIIPVLIDDAGIPDAETLPATIEQLVVQNVAPMHNNQYFEQDINTLLDDITKIGVARQVQGFIQNPPSAGLNKRQAAAIVGIPLVFIIIGCVVVLGLGYLGFNFISNSALNLTPGKCDQRRPRHTQRVLHCHLTQRLLDRLLLSHARFPGANGSPKMLRRS